MFNLYLGAVLSSSSAYLLVSHGSRDPRPGVAIAQLRELVQQRLDRAESPLVLAGVGDGESASPRRRREGALVDTSVLECGATPLHEQIVRFAAAGLSQGIRRIQIVPLFLLPGVHVKEDLPEQMAIAQQHLGASVELTLCPFLGSQVGLQRLLADRLTAQPAAHILLSHGSRRSQGNAPVEALAQQLGAVAAYWSVAPSLEMQVQTLLTRGERRIAIFPYFMFPGAIGDAIAQQVAQLAQQWPSLQLMLLSPLAADQALAQLVVGLTQP